MEGWEKQIDEILGADNERNLKNANRYLDYLKEILNLPCLLTGTEDFPWEEPYILGGWDHKEYDEKKKTMPSYKDQYELIKLLPPSPRYDDVMAKVKRLKDSKIFEIGLSWLKCLDRKHPNYKVIDTYGMWHTNY